MNPQPMTLAQIVKKAQDDKDLTQVRQLYQVESDSANTIRALCELLFLANKCIPTGALVDVTPKERAEIDKKVRDYWRSACDGLGISIPVRHNF